MFEIPQSWLAPSFACSAASSLQLAIYRAVDKKRLRDNKLLAAQSTSCQYPHAPSLITMRS